MHRRMSATVDRQPDDAFGGLLRSEYERNRREHACRRFGLRLSDFVPTPNRTLESAKLADAEKHTETPAMWIARVSE